MIELEIVYQNSRWIEEFTDFHSANTRWNELMMTSAVVYTSTNFNFEIIS